MEIPTNQNNAIKVVFSIICAILLMIFFSSIADMVRISRLQSRGLEVVGYINDITTTTSGGGRTAREITRIHVEYEVQGIVLNKIFERSELHVLPEIGTEFLMLYDPSNPTNVTTNALLDMNGAIARGIISSMFVILISPFLLFGIISKKHKIEIKIQKDIV